MRVSVESICRHEAPASSERHSPEFWIRNIRCAFVFIAIATDVRPASRGRLPPLISVQVTPSSVDLNRCVWLPPPPPPPPPTPHPRSPKTRQTCGRPVVVAHRRREHDAGLVVRPGDLLRARRVIDVERLGPRAAAVGRTIHAAGVALLVHVTLRGE